MKDYELIERLEQLKKQVLISRIILLIEAAVLAYLVFTNQSENYYILISLAVVMVIVAIFSIPKQFEARKLQRQLNERND